MSFTCENSRILNSKRGLIYKTVTNIHFDDWLTSITAKGKDVFPFISCESLTSEPCLSSLFCTCTHAALPLILMGN